MPIIQVTGIGKQAAVVSDPGASSFTMTIPPGQSAEEFVPDDVLARLRIGLERLRVTGQITWKIVFYPPDFPGAKGDKGDKGDSAVFPPLVWHLVGAGGEPAFQNDWANVNNPDVGGPLAFALDVLGFVILRGVVAGSENTVCFTLPLGFRPTYLMRFPNNPVNSITGMQRIDISPNGDVLPLRVADPGGNTIGAWFDGIRFWPGV